MCGIVGIVSRKRNVVNDLISSLKKLEYRGYDSSGISLVSNKTIKSYKKQGKIVHLENHLLDQKKPEGNIGIAHTRWATHGEANDINSHPHYNEDVSVVHNGIIENYQTLKEKLEKDGYQFYSKTDSEVIPALIRFYLKKNYNKQEVVSNVINDLEGSFAIAIIFKNENNLIVVAKKESPLIIGYGNKENYIASDYQALHNFTKEITYLKDLDIAFISNNEVKIYNKNQLVTREIKTIDRKIDSTEKDGFEHFMLKEIFEQPAMASNIIKKYCDIDNNQINLLPKKNYLKQFDKITLLACGTSYYACLLAKFVIHNLTNIEVEVDIASEFRYKNSYFSKNNLFIFISQSGETADTLACLKLIKEKGYTSLAIVNSQDSTMANLADLVIKLEAGIEIGVASTKAFMAQVIVMILFSIDLACQKKSIDTKLKKKLLIQLFNNSNNLDYFLTDDFIKKIKDISKIILNKKSILYIGRGISSIIALEAALKLKELSYINAQALPSGELKHGTIALIDEESIIISLISDNNLLSKNISNLEEIKARKGNIISISDKKTNHKIKDIVYESINVLKITDQISESILNIIPIQLIAYYTALQKGNDVDQPRNLAKSVTVE